MTRRAWKAATAVGGYLAFLAALLVVVFASFRPEPLGKSALAIVGAFVLGFSATVFAVVATKPSKPIDLDRRKRGKR